MRLRNWLLSFWEDAKAYRRGQTRIAPRGARGRIYAQKADGSHVALAPGEASVKIVHTCAKDGTQRVYEVK